MVASTSEVNLISFLSDDQRRETKILVEQKPGRFIGRGAYGRAAIAHVFLGRDREQQKPISFVRKQYPAEFNLSALQELGQAHRELIAEPTTPTFGTFRVDEKQKAVYSTDLTQNGRWTVVSMNELLHPNAEETTLSKDPMAVQRLGRMDTSILPQQLLDIVKSTSEKYLWLVYFDVFFLLVNDEGETRVMVGDLDQVTKRFALSLQPGGMHSLAQLNAKVAIDWLESWLDSDIVSSKQKRQLRENVIPELQRMVNEELSLQPIISEHA